MKQEQLEILKKAFQDLFGVFLMEWVVPKDGRHVPILRDGRPVIARVPITAMDIAQLGACDTFMNKMTCMNRIFGYHGISDCPALVRITLDYLIKKSDRSRIPVESSRLRGIRVTVPADKAIQGQYHTTMVILCSVAEQMYTAITGERIEVTEEDLKQLAMSFELTVGVPGPAYGLDWKSVYRGDQSGWLEQQLEDWFSPLRTEENIWPHVQHLVAQLTKMLGKMRPQRPFRIKNTLRPMRIAPGRDGTYHLNILPRLDKNQLVIDDALFGWMTETLPEQMHGAFSFSPRTHFLFCTKHYLVLMDYRIVREQLSLGLFLPDLYMIAIDLSRDLAYVLYFETLPSLDVSVRYALLEFIVGSDQKLMLILALLNGRNSLPRMIGDQLDSVEFQRLEFRVPKWLNSRATTAATVDVRLLSEWKVGHLHKMELLPGDFDRYLQDVLWWFSSVCYKGMKTRILYDVNKMFLFQTSSPFLIGLASGINRIEGFSDFPARKIYHRWMTMAFMHRNLTPWHILAWRFLDIAVTSGLRNRYARHLYRVDKTTAQILFGWRTVVAKGEPIPIVTDSGAVIGKNPVRYDSSAILSSVPYSHLGRRLLMTPSEYEQHIVQYDEEKFLARWPALQSLLELMLSED